MSSLSRFIVTLAYADRSFGISTRTDGLGVNQLLAAERSRQVCPGETTHASFPLLFVSNQSNLLPTFFFSLQDQLVRQTKIAREAREELRYARFNKMKYAIIFRPV